jgi:hypothetical protein
MNKFEQLIEYVINDEDAKARELFHDIVVEKSRQIYEEMMDVEEAADEEEESIEEAADEEEESIEEGALGGDQSDDLMNDVEMEEQGMSEDEESDAEFDDGAEEAGAEVTHGIEDHHDDMGGNENLEDRVVDLEDKLDELMAEFESMMGDDAPGEEVSGDEFDDMTDVEVADDEMETENMFNENINLKTVSTPSNTSVSSKSPVAANSGARGAMAKPVHATGDGGNGRPAPTAKELIGKVQNTPAQGSVKQSPAPKPHLAQATGVNTKSVTH